MQPTPISTSQNSNASTPTSSPRTYESVDKSAKLKDIQERRATSLSLMKEAKKELETPFKAGKRSYLEYLEDKKMCQEVLQYCELVLKQLEEEERELLLPESEQKKQKLKKHQARIEDRYMKLQEAKDKLNNLNKAFADGAITQQEYDDRKETLEYSINFYESIISRLEKEEKILLST